MRESKAILKPGRATAAASLPPSVSTAAAASSTGAEINRKVKIARGRKIPRKVSGRRRGADGRTGGRGGRTRAGPGSPPVRFAFHSSEFCTAAVEGQVNQKLVIA